MKKFATNAGLLFTALAAICLTSCTPKDDFDAVKPKAEVTGKASVTVALTSEGDASTTGKQVNRGSLHAWISEIDVTTKSNDFNYAPFMTPFILTNDAIGTTNANGLVEGTYNLDGVALGSNDFTVVTKTGTPQILSFESTIMAPQARIDLMKVKNPYAIYNASILGFNVIAGANTLPSTELKTQHGRLVGVFTLSQTLKDLGVTAKVSVAPSILVNVPTSVITVGIANNASFYLSNAASTDAKIVSFTVELLDIHGTVFKTLAATMTVKASTSVNTIFTINQSNITSNTAMDVFTAQPWDNQDGGEVIGN